MTLSVLIRCYTVPMMALTFSGVLVANWSAQCFVQISQRIDLEQQSFERYLMLGLGTAKLTKHYIRLFEAPLVGLLWISIRQWYESKTGEML